MDKHDAAVAEMRLAEKLDPAYVQAYLTLGQLYAQKRNYREARRQLERAVQLDRKRAEAYYTLGSVYHHLGMTAKSQSSYKTFQQLKSAQPKPDPVAEAIQGSTAADSK
jgi:tetratricopeptide (TPR) repeat protein